MKYKLLVTAAIILALILGACAESEIAEEPVSTPPPVITPEVIAEPDTPAELPNLKPLELLGYFIDENDYIWFNYPSLNEYAPEAFKEYFLGSWNGNWFGEDIVLIIDESEKSSVGHMFEGMTVWANDHVVAIPFPNNGVGAIYWIDINQPDKMYFSSGFGVNSSEQLASLGSIEEGWFSRAIGIFTKAII
jgi:hypothetical protein